MSDLIRINANNGNIPQINDSGKVGGSGDLIDERSNAIQEKLASQENFENLRTDRRPSSTVGKVLSSIGHGIMHAAGVTVNFGASVLSKVANSIANSFIGRFFGISGNRNSAEAFIQGQNANNAAAPKDNAEITRIKAEINQLGKFELQNDNFEMLKAHSSYDRINHEVKSEAKKEADADFDGIERAGAHLNGKGADSDFDGIERAGAHLNGKVEENDLPEKYDGKVEEDDLPEKFDGNEEGNDLPEKFDGKGDANKEEVFNGKGEGLDAKGENVDADKEEVIKEKGDGNNQKEEVINNKVEGNVKNEKKIDPDWWNKLSAEEKESIKNKPDWWNKLSAEEKASVKREEDYFNKLTDEQKISVRKDNITTRFTTSGILFARRAVAEAKQPLADMFNTLHDPNAPSAPKRDYDAKCFRDKASDLMFNMMEAFIGNRDPESNDAKRDIKTHLDLCDDVFKVRIGLDMMIDDLNSTIKGATGSLLEQSQALLKELTDPENIKNTVDRLQHEIDDAKNEYEVWKSENHVDQNEVRTLFVDNINALSVFKAALEKDPAYFNSK